MTSSPDAIRLMVHYRFTTIRHLPYRKVALGQVRSFPWMVIYAAQKGSYSGTSRGVLFRQITVEKIRCV